MVLDGFVKDISGLSTLERARYSLENLDCLELVIPGLTKHGLYQVAIRLLKIVIDDLEKQQRIEFARMFNKFSVYGKLGVPKSELEVTDLKTESSKVFKGQTGQ